MLQKHLDRICALVIVSGGIGWWLARDVLRKQRMGLDGFLVLEKAFFNKVVKDFSHPVAHALVYALLVATFFIAYEVIASIVRFCLVRSNAGEKS